MNQFRHLFIFYSYFCTTVFVACRVCLVSRLGISLASISSIFKYSCSNTYGIPKHRGRQHNPNTRLVQPLRQTTYYYYYIFVLGVYTRFRQSGRGVTVYGSKNVRKDVFCTYTHRENIQNVLQTH